MNTTTLTRPPPTVRPRYEPHPSQWRARWLLSSTAARRPRGHAAAGALRHLAAERLRCEFISLPGARVRQSGHLSSVRSLQQG
eukprot:6464243-Prymnesium_polylepis.1